MPDATPAPAAEPANKRFRTVEVRRVERITPKAVRITLGGDALEGFGTPLLGGHIKVMLPGTDHVRAYTPRRFDAARREIEVDVILHGDSPGSRWATAAKPGDPIDLRGPGGRGHIVDPTAAWHLLAGDACAVPAIGMVLESLPESTRAVVIIEVDDDGMGMTLERLDQPMSTGIGLANVRERLRVIYGAAYQLKLTSEPGKGTCARIEVPELSEAEKITA